MDPFFIYLDHAATTPVDPRVFEAMKPYFDESYGNPSSLHTLGQRAKEAVDSARRKVAQLLNCKPIEMLFTSGGTESNNLALLGVARAYRKQGTHIITTAIEHESVLEPLRFLEKHEGFSVTYLPVDRNGMVKMDAFEAALRPETILVSMIWANNEIGTIQPIAEFAEKLRNYRKSLKRDEKIPQPPFFHTDACQAAGALDLNVEALGVDLLTLNGGKIYGPKGVGALYVRRGIQLVPLVFGGGQEQKWRAGTENVAGIVGFSEALKLIHEHQEAENRRLLTLREHLIQGICSRLKDVSLNGHPEKRLPNNVNLTVQGIEGEILLMRLDLEGIYASAGSACTAGSADPSHVLLAIGVSKQDAYGSVRFSLGHSTTPEQIDHVVEVFCRVVREIRGESGRAEENFKVQNPNDE